jgi:hypothetical protein
MFGVDHWPKERAWSLKTKDELEARSLAGEAIGQHLDLLLYHEARHSVEHWADKYYAWEMEPNTRENRPDGTMLVASAETITTISPDGTIASRPNRKRPVLNFTEAALQSHHGKAAVRHAESMVKALTKDVDADMLKAYTARLRSDDQRLAEYGLVRFKELNGGKTIAQSNRSDVKKLIEAEMQQRGPNGGARVQKMIRWLCAAVNHNIADADVPYYDKNIFEKHEIEVRKNKRPSYTEADIRKIKENIGIFTEEEQIMVIWHIASSVRPVGIYSIKHCEILEEDQYDDHGNLVKTHHTRSIQIEKDKDDEMDYGDRKLPIPQAVLDLKREDGSSILPVKIEGCLFETPLAQLLVEINRKLDALGVNTPDIFNEKGEKVRKGKSFYSARHRARDRFRQMKTNEEMSRAIMGHARDQSDAHRGYGHGFNMYELKEVIDRIRF